MPAFNDRPLLLLLVRLFNAVTLLGTLTPAALPPKDRLDDDGVDRLVGVPAMAGPLSTSVFAPTANVPLFSVSVPLTATFALRLTPAVLLSVRLLTVAGRPLVTCAPVVPLKL